MHLLKPVFPSIQQNKLNQLQQEIEALEKQLGVTLKNQQLEPDYSNSSPIPLTQIDEQTARTGIKLTSNLNS